MTIHNIGRLRALSVQFVFALLACLAMTQSALAALYTNSYGSVLPTVSNCDDCFEGPISFGGGQDINFFGTTYSGLYVGSNGYATFGSGSTSFSSVPLDTQTLNPMIAGLFTDLDSRDVSAEIYANTSTPGQIIITYVMLGHFSSNFAVRSTFQLVVRSDTFAVPVGEGQIGFYYDSITDTNIASGGFGDGLAAVNPGEVAIFSEVAANTRSNAAPRWFNLAGGLPITPSPPVSSASIPTLPEFAQALLVGFLAIVGLLAIRRRQLVA
jgi:hypothetical protein